jgi:hypothetical protein
MPHAKLQVRQADRKMKKDNSFPFGNYGTV